MQEEEGRTCGRLPMDAFVRVSAQEPNQNQGQQQQQQQDVTEKRFLACRWPGVTLEREGTAKGKAACDGCMRGLMHEEEQPDEG